MDADGAQGKKANSMAKVKAAVLKATLNIFKEL